MTKLINVLKFREDYLIATIGEKIYRIPLNEIYYFEAIDRKLFLYAEKDVYEVKGKLYQIEEKYKELDFVRISKAMIINIDKMETVYPVLSGRLELKLNNGEVLQISRNYFLSVCRFIIIDNYAVWLKV